MLARFAAVFALLVPLAAQDTSLLRVRVTLGDAAATPIPGVILLVSDNPATGEPRRVRTGADGTVELKLKPGTYIVESDRAISFAGKGYTWTQVVEVMPGRPAVVELNAGNAEIGAAPADAPARATAAIASDAAVAFAKWRDSVVEIWTPTTHASGFIIDKKGLIATSHHALNAATAVEVQFSSAAGSSKVAGTVIVDDRLTGAALIWVSPEAIAATTAIDPKCGGTPPTIAYEDDVSTIVAPMLMDRENSTGVVFRITSQAIYADFRIRQDETGGPVFTGGGELLGISALNVDVEKGRPVEPWAVPVDKVCDAIAAALKKIEAATPPAATRLPIESVLPKTIRTLDAKTQRTQPPTISASDFDITLLTPAQARLDDLIPSPRTDFGNWDDYVRADPRVLFIRVSPQFEEGFWKMLARGAAATQGVALPPLKSFSANFLKLRAYCGDVEVTPIHPFVIERRVAEKATIKEGLYAYDPAAFGPGCPTVRLSMYSEKDPQKADTKTIDPKLFQQVANSLQ